MVAEPRECCVGIVVDSSSSIARVEEQDLGIQWLEGIWPQDTCSMTAEAGGSHKHDGLAANILTIYRTVRTLLITKCEGKALSPPSSVAAPSFR